jgi:hypothetical protein
MVGLSNFVCGSYEQAWPGLVRVLRLQFFRSLALIAVREREIELSLCLLKCHVMTSNEAMVVQLHAFVIWW